MVRNALLSRLRRLRRFVGHTGGRHRQFSCMVSGQGLPSARGYLSGRKRQPVWRIWRLPELLPPETDTALEIAVEPENETPLPDQALSVDERRETANEPVMVMYDQAPDQPLPSGREEQAPTDVAQHVATTDEQPPERHERMRTAVPAPPLRQIVEIKNVRGAPLGDRTPRSAISQEPGVDASVTLPSRGVDKAVHADTLQPVLTANAEQQSVPEQVAVSAPPTDVAAQERSAAEAEASEGSGAPPPADRSPQAWRARLLHAVEAEQAAKEAGTREKQPTPAHRPQPRFVPTASTRADTSPTNPSIRQPSTQRVPRSREEQGQGMAPPEHQNEGAMRREEDNGVTTFITPRISSRRESESLAHAVPSTDTRGSHLQTEPATQRAVPSHPSQQRELQSPDMTTPLSTATRRFLRPLVGIDPASVRVHRGPAADRITTAYAADAMTVGNDVLLAPGHADDTPETLGLLAHEFTHVARQRQPHFIPPLVHTLPQRTEQEHLGSVPSENNEEDIAQQMEAQVQHAARAWIDRGRRSPTPVETTQANPMPAPSDAVTLPEVTATTRYDAVPHLPSSGDGTSPQAQPPATRWGQLPAPWEPLPEWATTPHQETITSVQEPHGQHQASSASPAPETAIQRAARGRTIHENTSAATEASSSASERTQQPEADLDALARQVYSVLRRRLAAERQRQG